jgi:hypothetical protein
MALQFRGQALVATAPLPLKRELFTECPRLHLAHLKTKYAKILILELLREVRSSLPRTNPNTQLPNLLWLPIYRKIMNTPSLVIRVAHSSLCPTS